MTYKETAQMPSQKILDALNEQLRHELNSEYSYLAVSAYCHTISLPGFAHWFYLQSAEERAHAMKIYNFILDRNGQVKLKALDAPPYEFGSPLQIAQKALEAERKVTGYIDQLYELAQKENDYPVQVMLQWFINEQVEEEKNATLLIDQLTMVGDNRAALLMLDMELGKRTGAES
jgi:ferritin